MRGVQIESPDDPRIADFVGLRDRELMVRGRGEAGGPGVFVAEGDQVIARAVRAGYRVLAVLVDETRVERLDELMPGVAAQDPDVFVAGATVAEAITKLGVHRGSIAVLARRRVPPAVEVLAAARRVVILDGVANPVNLGVIARTAAAFGFDAMLLAEGCCDPLYRRASRVSMGEVFSLPYAWIPPCPTGLVGAGSAGFTTVALTPSTVADPIDGAGIDRLDRVALVLGSEGYGSSDDTIAACDRTVRIPIAEDVDSLNVGAAAAVAMWEIR